MRVLEWKRRPCLVLAVLSSTVGFALVSLFHLRREQPSQRILQPDSGHNVSAHARARLGENTREDRASGDADFLPSPLLLPRLAEYCNIPDGAVTDGQEGEAPKDYILESVYVIILHGTCTARTVLLDLHQPSPNCTMNRESLHHFPQLRHFLSDMEAQRDQQSAGSREFTHWALYPRHRHCSSWQLTGQGVLQHLLNGLALKDKYIRKWNLFGREFSPSEQLHVHTTQVSRTYQSAVALLYAFLPHFNFTQLNLHAARNAMFCDSSAVPTECCTGLHHLQQKMEREQWKRKKWNLVGIPVLEAVADVLGVKITQLSLSQPGVLADVLQSYVCHRLPLPCGNSGKCVTAAMVKDLFQVADSEAEGDSKDVGFDRYSRLFMQPLLLQILTSMVRVSRNQSSVRFTLYSGHDLTLTSLLQALGVQEGRQPKHAARIVLELYRKGDSKFKGSHHLRVVRDGKDVTSLVRFCRGRTVSGMCRLRQLETFVTRDNGAIMAATDRQGLASFCHLRNRF